jgi:hypothetical protein
MKGQKYSPKVCLLSGREDLNLRPHGLQSLSYHQGLCNTFEVVFRDTIFDDAGCHSHQIQRCSIIAISGVCRPSARAAYSTFDDAGPKP